MTNFANKFHKKFNFIPTENLCPSEFRQIVGLSIRNSEWKR